MLLLHASTLHRELMSTVLYFIDHKPAQTRLLHFPGLGKQTALWGSYVRIDM
jgi:hypothetical protein